MKLPEILDAIENLAPAELEDSYALEYENGHGKQIRYSYSISQLWNVCEETKKLHESSRSPFQYFGIVRIPSGLPCFYYRNIGGDLLQHGDLQGILRLVTEEKELQESKRKSLLNTQDNFHPIEGF